MTDRVASRKERLYRDLNAKLRKFDPSLGSDILCPICFQRFGLDSLETKDLSLEHVPPKAVSKLIAEKGLRTLLCTSCNNTAGYRLQNDLKQFIKAQLHTHGKYTQPLPSTITIEGGSPMQCNIIWTPSQVQAVGVPKANNPSTIKQHLSALEASCDSEAPNLELNVNFNYGCEIAKVRSAYLHIAYLAAFILTGCAYPFTEAGARLRSLIATGQAHLLGPCLIEPDVIGVGGRSWTARITEPSHLRCIWVKLAGNIVLLPLPDDHNLSCYHAWQEVSQDNTFGLKPQGPLAFRATFPTREDAMEAAKCMPRVFPTPRPLQTMQHPASRSARRSPPTKWPAACCWPFTE